MELGAPEPCLQACPGSSGWRLAGGPANVTPPSQDKLSIAMNNYRQTKCSGPGCGCDSGDSWPSFSAGGGVARRDFLKLLGGATAALAAGSWPGAMAGPFTRADFDKLVPTDKKLSPEWVKSLTARGERTIYRGADLAKIGMPIGGLCAGSFISAATATLWHWDIFNRKLSTGAEHYAKPMKPASPLDQGFALRVTVDGKTQERALDAAHWKDVSFIGEYPIGYVQLFRPGCAGHREPGGLFAVHPVECGGFLVCRRPFLSSR